MLIMLDVLRDVRALIELNQTLTGTILPSFGNAHSSSVEAEMDEQQPVEHTNVATPAELTPTPPVQTLASEPISDDMATTDLFGAPIDPALDPSMSPYDRIEALIPEESPLHNMTSLQEVEDYLRHTILTPIDESRLNPVFGVGNSNADLLVVGEAPGADEDKHGEPFVGRAGQLLNKILAAINFQRDEIYIANIMKSRPPGNRDPQPDEVAAHIPLLYKQIALIKPKLILAVGKTAGNGLLGRKSSLASLRGKFHSYHGIELMVTYHPAALLRNPQWKRPTWEDVKLLRTRYDQVTTG
ncbi:MAG: uracil-DNA glycosylase [Rhodothermales bacterium]